VTQPPQGPHDPDVPSDPYAGSAQFPAYGQQPPAYGQWAPPAQQPYGPPDWDGQQVWQAPQYGGHAPTWQSSYGQGDGPLAGVRTADAGPRLGARILDWLIVGIPFGLLGFALGYYDTSPVADPTAPGSVWTPVTVALSIGELVARFVYHAAFLAMKGATPGKMVCGIRVIDENTGQRISFGRGLLRELVLMLSALPCLIGYFSLFFDSLGLKRAWHDKAVKSRVVRS